MVRIHNNSRQIAGCRTGNYRKPTDEKAEVQSPIDVEYARRLGRLAEHYVEIGLTIDFDEGLDMAEAALGQKQD